MLNFDDGRFKTVDGREYQYNSWGGISQTDAKPYAYNQQYNETYNTPAYKQASKRLIDIRMNVVRQGCKTINSLLDFGYGNGAFLDEASKYYLNCKGFDVAETDYHKGKSWERIEWLDYDNPPDVACFWDSLEHTESPESIVFQINAPTVVISLPWLDIDGYFDTWHHRKPDEHLHHFNKESLACMMQDCGYKMVSCGNMEDEVRVSKENNPNILTAIFLKY